MRGVYGQGPGYILKNNEFMGERWGKRLSILEGFRPAQTMSIRVEDIRKAGAVAIRVDNSGFVRGFVSVGFYHSILCLHLGETLLPERLSRLLETW
jgi:hypothetical protein